MVPASKTGKGDTELSRGRLWAAQWRHGGGGVCAVRMAGGGDYQGRCGAPSLPSGMRTDILMITRPSLDVWVAIGRGCSRASLRNARRPDGHSRRTP
jgi:hypothetical protein